MKKSLLIFFVVCATKLFAQKNDLYFNHLTVANGLPTSQINVSMQDRHGYIWMGTQNGVVRYDGYNIKPYSIADSAGKPIPYYNVDQLYEDANGTLWIDAESAGLYYYAAESDTFKKAAIDANLQKFSRYQPVSMIPGNGGEHWEAGIDFNGTHCILLHLDTLSHRVEKYVVSGKGNYFLPCYYSLGVTKDGANRIWAISDSLLCLYNPANKSFSPYFVLPAASGATLFNDVYADPIDSDVLWLTTYKVDKQSALPYTVVKYNVKNKLYKIFFDHTIGIAKQPGGCTTIFTDSLKRVWFTDDQTLFCYNRQADTVRRYKLFAQAISINSIASAKDSSIWVGSKLNGLIKLRPRDSSVEFYSSTNKTGSISQLLAGINNVFVDKAGILWLSGLQEDMEYVNPDKSFFKTVQINPPKAPGEIRGRVDNYVCGIINDSTFLVTGLSGVFTWNFLQNTFTPLIIGVGLAQPLNQDLVKLQDLLLIDRDGDYWMHDGNYNLYCYNPVTKKTTKYMPVQAGRMAAHKMVQGIDGTIWIGTWATGLWSLDKKTGQFKYYNYVVNDGSAVPANALDDNWVNTMIVAHDGILWIGTEKGGLNTFDPATGHFTSYHNSANGLQTITALHEDAANRIWAGTYLSGLFLFDEKQRTYKAFTEKDGLLYDGVNDDGLQEDKNGNIWVLSLRGLSFVNGKTLKASGVKGLSIDEELGFYRDAFYAGRNGNFYLRRHNSLIYFNPANKAINTTPPAVVIESMVYSNADDSSGVNATAYTSNGHAPNLRYNQDKITFHFVALHFADAAENNYMYQLVGYDNDWVNAGTQRSATYTNLHPGTYTFKVKACNSDGVWNEEGTAITFTIYPPWWATWWAITLFALMAAGAIWAFVYYRSKQLVRANKALEQKVQQRTQQVTEQKEEIAAQRDSLETALNELTTTQAQLVQREKMASLGELTPALHMKYKTR